MKTTRKVLFIGALGALMVVGLYANFALTAAGTAPTSTAGCVKQPDGTFTSNGRVCDRVDYTVFKKGLVPYIDPYFYHLVASGWTFLNYSRGGSFFTTETHNIITSLGQQYLQLQAQSCGGTGSACLSSSTGNTFYGSTGPTTFVAQYLAVSSSSTAPAYADTVCNSEITEFTLTRTVAKFTGASPTGSGSISPTLTATWTATAPYNNIQLGCTYNTPSVPTSGTLTSLTGAGGVLYAENTFSSVNLNAGDQLTITWTFTYSG
jgi:hypothetical protein